MATTHAGVVRHARDHTLTPLDKGDATWSPDPGAVDEIARIIHRSTHTTDAGHIGISLCRRAARDVLIHQHTHRAAA